MPADPAANAPLPGSSGLDDGRDVPPSVSVLSPAVAKQHQGPRTRIEEERWLANRWMCT